MIGASSKRSASTVFNNVRTKQANRLDSSLNSAVPKS